MTDASPEYDNKEHQSNDRTITENEVDLKELLSVIWRGKWIICAITAVFAIGALLYALSLPNIYRSEVTLAPTEEVSGGGMARMAGQLGSLANLAGVSLGGNKTDKTTIALEILRSRAFITAFVEKYGILPEIMAVDYWSADSGIVYDNEVYDSVSSKWVRDVEPPRRQEPSSWEYVEIFKNELLEISKDDVTGLVKVAINHESPEFAKAVVEWLVEEINSNMRVRDIEEAKRSLDYLNQELDNISLNNMQQVFYGLVEQQMQTIMLANVRPEYIFQTLDPAVVPEQPSKPFRVLICLMGIISGGFFSLIIVFTREIFKR